MQEPRGGKMRSIPQWVAFDSSMGGAPTFDSSASGLAGGAAKSAQKRYAKAFEAFPFYFALLTDAANI